MPPNYKKYLNIVDLKGGVWLGLFSLVMLVAVIKSTLFNGSDIQTGVLGVYGTVIGAFAVSKLGAKAINGKNGHTVPED